MHLHENWQMDESGRSLAKLFQDLGELGQNTNLLCVRDTTHRFCYFCFTVSTTLGRNTWIVVRLNRFIAIFCYGVAFLRKQHFLVDLVCLEK